MHSFTSRIVLTLTVVAATLTLLEPVESTTWRYPQAVPDTSIVENKHGQPIYDPYRWLENPTNPMTKKFIEQENMVTREYLQRDKNRAAYRQKLAELYGFTRMACPYRVGNRYYTDITSAGQERPVMYYQESLNEPRKVFFDSNTLSKDGSARMADHEFSESGNYFAYAVSYGGSDETTIYTRCVKDTPLCKAGTSLKHAVEKAKYTDIAWTHDDLGFFYQSYEKLGANAGPANAKQEDHQNPMIYYHRLNTPQSQDQLVYYDPSGKDEYYSMIITDDGRWLMIYVDADNPNSHVLVAPLTKNKGMEGQLKFNRLFGYKDVVISYLANNDNIFYFYTNLNAPRYKIVAYDITKSDGKLIDIVPQHPVDILRSVSPVARDYLILSYLQDAKPNMAIHELKTGNFVRYIDLPTGSISFISSLRKDNEFFFSFTSFTEPNSVYHYSFATQKVLPFHRVNIPNLDSSSIVAERVLVTSAGGVKFPLFIARHKDVKPGQPRPVLLYGYGGFSTLTLPLFNAFWYIFIKHFRGIVALAAVRGGGEYGDVWHKSGILHNKQNSITDFQNAARYLISKKYTLPQLITAEGASNGGLLVAAAINQTPELFGCGLPSVGVMDMLRFHKFTAGRFWKPEYGDPEKKEDFMYLRTYSPLHNIPKTNRYPAMLLMTSDGDDRVVPSHSYKMAAQLQQTLPNNPNPLMLLVNTKSGHGGQSTSQQIDKMVDKCSFMAMSLGLQWYP